MTNQEMIKGLKSIAKDLMIYVTPKEAKKIMFANKNECEYGVVNKYSTKDIIIKFNLLNGFDNDDYKSFHNM
jgi:hypothetical protein|tara:strand:- start:1522 stop:1737 length:216 start_codon:yes stop_codon:yes gene_type:complete